MKGTWAYALTLAVLLTGCGAKPETQTPAPAETAAQTAAPETAALEETTVPEDTAAPETAQAETPAVETDAPVEETAAPSTLDGQYPDGDWDAIVTSYKTAIVDKVDAAKAISTKYNDGEESYTMDYALYDIDHNGTPELLIRYGTCEADSMIAVYSYRNNALVKLADQLPGSHTSFGYDYKANQLVLIQGHMGAGDMVWYDLDDNGELIELIDTGGFSFGGEGEPDYDDFLDKYNVAFLPMSSSFSFGSDEKTYIYDGSGDYENAPEFDGLNFSLLESYQY